MSVSSSHTCTLKLFFLNLNLFCGGSFHFNSELFFFLQRHELILSYSDKFGGLIEVFPQSLVLECKIVHLPLHILILGFSHVSILVPFEDITLPLKLVVFFV